MSMCACVSVCVCVLPCVGFHPTTFHLLYIHACIYIDIYVSERAVFASPTCGTLFTTEKVTTHVLLCCFVIFGRYHPRSNELGQVLLCCLLII